MPCWFITPSFMQYLDYTREEAYYSARFEKDSRYYVIRLEKDLFDYWTINAINGRIKSKLGQSRILAFFSFQEAFDAFCDMAIVRYQRHYHLKYFSTEASLLPQLMAFMPNSHQLKHQNDNIKKKAATMSNIRHKKTIPIKIEQKPPFEQACFSF